MADSPLARLLASPETGFRGGVAWNVASLGVLGISGILVNLLIAGFAGAEALGVFNQAYAVYIFASQLAVGGLQFSVLHHLSHRAGERRTGSQIAVSALALATLLSLLVGGAVALCGPVASRLLASEGIGPALLAASPGLVFFSLNKVLLSVLNALRWMRAFALFNSLRFVLILAGIALLLALPLPAELLIGALSFAELLLFLVLAVFVHRRVLPLTAGATAAAWWRRHGEFGVKSFLSGTLTELNTRVDVLVLGFFLDDRAVGVYSLAAIFAEGFNQLPYVLRNNLDPLLGNRFADCNLERIEWYAKQIKRVFWPTMAAAGALALVLYPLLVHLVFGGGEFGRSIGVFAILVVGVVLSSGHRPFAGILAQGGRPEISTLVIFLVVLGNVAGNVALIPRFGLLGAAAATAAMLLLEAILLVFFARRLFGVRL